MTWLTTWPEAAVPQYAEHASEAAAEVHAASLVRRGVAHAVVFWRSDPHRTREVAARGANRGEVAPSYAEGITGRQNGTQRIEGNQ